MRKPYKTKRPTKEQLAEDVQTLHRQQIAEKYDVTYPCVGNWLRMFGLRTLVRKAKQFDVDTFRELAKTNTTKQLAAEYGVTSTCVSAWCHKHGIRAFKRTRKDSYSRKGRLWPVISKLFYAQEQSDAEIGRQFDCTREYVGQIRAAMRTHGLL